MKKIDIIVKSCARDLNRLSYLLKSSIKYFSGYNRFIVYLDDDNLCRQFSSTYSANNFEFHFVVPKHLNGYIYQQFIKLNGLKISDADYLLPIDSDMIFFRASTPADWFVDEKPFINYGKWIEPELFPPIDFPVSILNKINYRTHDLRLLFEEFKKNLDHSPFKLVSEEENEVVLSRDQEKYKINKNRLHDTWMWCLKNIVTEPIDTMRIHYIFERECLDYVAEKLEQYTGKSLEDAIFDLEYFPVFSEYEVYGNLIFNSEKFQDKYLFYKDGIEAQNVAANLPVIKCNSRVDSAFQVYDEILNEKYSEYKNRNEVLKEIRTRRSSSLNEDWN
jgi:hypothetical protein